MSEQNENQNNIQVISEGGGSVGFAAERDQLKKIVSDLLGEPQTIAKYFDGSFDINKNSVAQIDHLVRQRLKQQNEGDVISLIIKVTYDDNSTITYNSLESFEAYNEIGPLLPTAISFSWVLLVKFPHKDTPEKQSIELGFQTEKPSKIRITGAGAPFIFGPAPVNMTIEHTARTWGADIEAMLTKHINQIVCKNKGLRGFVGRHDGKISVITFLMILFGSSLAALYHSKQFINSNLADAGRISALPSDKYEYVAERVDYLIGITASGVMSMHIYYLILYGILVMIIGVFSAFFVSNFAGKSQPSFLTFTDYAVKNRDDMMRKYRRDWVMFFVSLFGGVLASILANVVYGVVLN